MTAHRNRFQAVSTLFLILACALPCIVFAQTTPVEGTWSGGLDIQGAKLPLVFNVSLADGVLKATMDSPAQGVKGIPVAGVSAKNGTLSFDVAVLGGKFEGLLSADGSKASGAWMQGGANLPLVLERQSAAFALIRPQEPQAPFPYSTREVRFEGGASGVSLVGTLILPEHTSGGNVPAVVMVTGSGPQDRNEFILGHKTFLVLADALARRGIASLRWDDRGVGASGGNFASATTMDFADDALAALAWLSAQPGIDSGRMGIIGHSEGGIVAPIAAVRDRRVGFIVLLAGPGIRGDKLLLSQNEAILRASGASDESISQLNKVNSILYDIVLTSTLKGDALAVELKSAYIDGIRNVTVLSEKERESAVADADSAAAQLASPWVGTFLATDPAEWLAKVTIPVLAINGTKDVQVPWKENLAAIDEALPVPHSPFTRIIPLEGLNHLFQTAGTGLPDEYGSITETFSPAAIDLIVSWIGSLP
ncbi:MAG: alpha/beta hydrolase [Rectinemataceae bacterium]